MERRFIPVLAIIWMTTLPVTGSDVPIPLSDRWAKRDNATLSVVREEGLGEVLKIDGNFIKIPYTWARSPMVRGGLDGNSVKALTLSARGEGVGTLGIVLVRKDGDTEVKFTREVPLTSSWKRWTLPLSGFLKGKEAPTAEDWDRSEGIMWFLQKTKGSAASAWIASPAWVDTLPSAAETTVVLLDLAKDNPWKGAVSVVDAPDRPGKKALRLDGSVPDGMTLENPPHDWSAADTFAIEAYSAQETGALIEIILHSKVPGSSDFSYLKQTVKVNWKGWRTLEFPFAKFSPNRNPAGFSKIDSVQWVVDGWGHKAVSGTALSILSMEARVSTNIAQKAPPVVVAEGHRKDLAIIQARATETLIPELSQPLTEMPEAVSKSLESMGEDGSWADVNYGDKSRAVWAPAVHLDRIAPMAIAWVRLGLGKADAGKRKNLKDGIDRALDYWFKRDPQSENWWWNMIGAQLTLSRIALALEPVLTPEQRAAIVKIFLRSNTDGMTGGNLTWTGGLTIIRGCIEKNPEAAVKAFGLIYDEVRMAPDDEEGVKSDGSFHQHGQQIYNQGYGAGYAIDASRFMFYAAGTAFQFPKEKADVLATYALDGSRWMLYRNVFDYSCRGREITRSVRGFGVSYLAEVCKNLKLQEGPRQGEIAAFHAELTNKVNSLVGNKYFWKSDYMAHRRTNFMFSVKMLSSRMQSGELVNDEGKKSHLLSDGLTYLYSGDGQAYHNIFPVWDWKRLPGITAEWSEEPPKGPVPSRGETPFAGGVSEGGFGAVAMRHKRDALLAQKSWFFFDGEMVALGSGITGGKAVNTTLDQSLKTGDVVVSAAGKETVAKGESRYEAGPEFIHHRGLGFVPLAPQPMALTVAPRTGSWKEISGSASATPITTDLMTLWVDHGSAKGSTYAYAVVVGDLPATRQWVKQSPIRVIANTVGLAAVEHPGLGIAQAVFYAADGFRSADGLSITTDGPAMLMIRKTVTGWVLSVAHPEARDGILGVTVNRKLTGTGASWESSRGFTRIRIPLPGGDEAGKTVSLELSEVR